MAGRAWRVEVSLGMAGMVRRGKVRQGKVGYVSAW